ETVIERFKKSLLDTAAFVITDQTVVGKPPLAAKLYVSQCRMLQSEIGSYVAKVELPGGLRLAPATLFRETAVTSDTVNDKACDVIEHLFSIGQGPADPFDDNALFDSLDVVNV